MAKRTPLVSLPECVLEFVIGFLSTTSLATARVACKSRWKVLCTRSIATLLRRSLQHENPNEREWAMKALVHSKTGDRRSAMFGIISKLEDADVEVRATALSLIDFIAERGDRGAARAIIGRFTHTNPEVRAAAIQSLLGVGGQGNPEVAKALLARLDDEDDQTRHLACEAFHVLVDRGDPEVVRSVLAHVRQASKVRDQIMLMRLVRDVALPGDTDATKVLLEHLDDADPEIRSAALDSLFGMLGHVAAKDDVGVIARVIACLKDNDATVREAALDSIKHAFGLKEDSDAVMERLREDHDSNGDARPFYYLYGPYLEVDADDAAHKQLAGAIDTIVGLLADMSQGVRCKVLHLLPRITDRQRREPVLALIAAQLDHPEPFVRGAALHAFSALSEKGDPGAMVTILAQTMHDTVAAVRAAGVKCLGQVAKHGDNNALLALIASIRDRDVNVRMSACAGVARLAKVGDARVLTALGSQLKDSCAMARQIALQGVTKLAVKGDSSVIDAVLACLGDSVEDIVTQAVCALPDLVEPGDMQALDALWGLLHSDRPRGDFQWIPKQVFKDSYRGRMAAHETLAYLQKDL